MCASPFDFLRSGPPPPRVVLLPDALLFARAVPVAAEVPPAEVAAQVELALEAMTPFPLSQLYYGYFWVPGSARALVFASYRRRFTAEQIAAWAGAELVLPTFAAVCGAAVEPATTLVLAAPEGLTAVHWDRGPVPDRVLFRPLLPDAPEEERVRVRDELLRSAGESKRVIDLAGPPAPESSRSDREVVFSSDEIRSVLPAEAAATLDVRDKGELAGLRRSRSRDVLIWRLALGSVAAFAALALGELALAGAGLWQRTRLLQLTAQQPTVDRIMTAESLATRINDLSTKRLLPLEMISILGSKKPDSIEFLSASTLEMYQLSVEAKTSNAGDIQGYQAALQELPVCDKVEIRNLRTLNNVASFTLVVTFKSGVLKPAPAASS